MKLELNHSANSIGKCFGFSETLTDDIEKSLEFDRNLDKPKSNAIETTFNKFVDKFDHYALPDNPKTEESLQIFYVYIGMCIARAMFMVDANGLVNALKDTVKEDLKSSVSDLLTKATQFDIEKFKKHLESDEDDF